MILLDASAVLELLLQTPKAAAIESRVLGKALRTRQWHVPHLLDVEIAHALRRLVAAGGVPAKRASEALEDLADLPLVRYPHDWLLARVWELRHNLTGYDAVYVALAEALEWPLITCDRKLAAAPGHDARLELI